MKKLTTAILAICLIISLVGCNTNKAPSSSSKGTNSSSDTPTASTVDENAPTAENPQIIKYWFPFGGDSGEFDEYRRNEFMKENPQYIIEATYAPPDSGISNGKLLAAIAAQDVPDVINAANTLSYPMASQGAFEDLTAVMKKIGRTPEDYQPSISSAMTIGDKWYLLPLETDTALLYINNERAKAVGLDPANPPKTIPELDAWAQKLTVTEGDTVKTMGFIPWIDGGDDTYIYAWAFGSPIYNPLDNTINLEDENFAKVFDWQATYAKKYNPEKIKSFSSGFGGAFSPDHAFFSGKVAMTLNGNWFNQAIKQYAPNIDFSMVPIPVAEGQQDRYGASPLAVVTFACPKGAANIEGACRFVDYIQNPTFMDENTRTWFTAPTRKDVVDQLPMVKEGDLKYKVITDMVFNKHSATPAMTSIRSIMAQEILSVRDRVLYEGKDPRELLKELQPKMAKELEKASK